MLFRARHYPGLQEATHWTLVWSLGTLGAKATGYGFSGFRVVVGERDVAWRLRELGSKRWGLGPLSSLLLHSLSQSLMLRQEQLVFIVLV